MHVHEHHPCTSVPFYVAQPLQAEPLPANAVAEQALEERKPEEAFACSLQELLGLAYAVYAWEPVVQYHVILEVLVHMVLLWRRCLVNPSPFQISFSPPYDMAAIHDFSWP